MSTFQVPAMLKGVSTLADGGVSLRFATQELGKDEMAMLMQKSGTFGWLLYSEQAIEEEELKLEAIRKDLKGKTPSERLKNSLYKVWTQTDTDKSFDQFYASFMEGVINKVKERIKEV
jgi:hypothetical protein